jgi:hypothetical protein
MATPAEMVIPRFDFPVPKGYRWIIDRGLVGFEPFTGLQPWHYLDATSVFEANQRWPHGPIPDRLVAFAKRQDNDDLACFRVQDGRVVDIAVIHGWTSEGYTVVAEHLTFWDFLKLVVDDLAEWSERAG